MLAGVSLVQPMNLGELEGTQLMLAARSGQLERSGTRGRSFGWDEREPVLHQTGAKSVRYLGGRGFPVEG